MCVAARVAACVLQRERDALVMMEECVAACVAACVLQREWRRTGDDGGEGGVGIKGRNSSSLRLGGQAAEGGQKALCEPGRSAARHILALVQTLTLGGQTLTAHSAVR